MHLNNKMIPGGLVPWPTRSHPRPLDPPRGLASTDTRGQDQDLRDPLGTLLEISVTPNASLFIIALGISKMEF